MFKLRNEYYFSAIICGIMSFIFIIILPIFFRPFLLKVKLNVFKSIGLGVLFLFVGLLNYVIADNDREKEKSKDIRIKQLENKLKNKNKDENYKMRNFDE